MNANELANETNRHLYNDTGKQYTLEKLLASNENMLRQLQAEIEALKRGNEATALLNYNKGYEHGTRFNIPFVPNPMPNPMPNPILHTRS